MPRHTFAAPLRWSDLDAYGHVNNARFMTLYEEARVALMFTHARSVGVDSFEQGIVIARHEVDYLRPLDFGAGPTGAPRAPVVRIELWVTELRASRFTVQYELFDADVVASRAKTICVPFDLAAGRPRRLSEAESQFLSAWTES